MSVAHSPSKSKQPNYGICNRRVDQPFSVVLQTDLLTQPKTNIKIQSNCAHISFVTWKFRGQNLSRHGCKRMPQKCNIRPITCKAPCAKEQAGSYPLAHPCLPWEYFPAAST
ncbi:hypothetical protein KIL84_022742 [Mauremys mutica]|uniref:Uncharacterized protein n=1 Tax=Mauremys mutica TaxID=74926 RepID=A0A9D3WRC5_9SAUR|nr:hypothetical protein KIL84_022742 [Mauremys mutica]